MSTSESKDAKICHEHKSSATDNSQPDLTNQNRDQEYSTLKPTGDPNKHQSRLQIAHNLDQHSGTIKKENRSNPTNSNESQFRGSKNNSGYASHPHVATAQNVFSGKSGPGMMCSNLRSNPFSIGSDQGTTTSTAILAKPKFSLKPSQFSSAKSDSIPSSSTYLSSTATANSFIRPAKLNYDSDDAETNSLESSVMNKGTTDDKNDNETPKQYGGHSDKLSQNGSGTVTEVATTTTSAATSQPSSEAFGAFGQNLPTFSEASSSSFVFGEKLDDRVTNVTKENGTTNGHASEHEKPRIQTVEEAVVEYKKQQEIGPTLPEVETKTGEEDESNVLQMNCKLFLLHEKERSWAEKGRGCLRLNDTDSGNQSRIVMRTIGIHRVILNTNIWSNMLCERANPRSLRITGTDGESDGVHVYLISGASSDIDHLYNALSYRIQHIKHSQSSAAAASDDSVSASKRKTSTDDSSELSPKKSRREEEEDEESRSSEPSVHS